MPLFDLFEWGHSLEPLQITARSLCKSQRLVDFQHLQALALVGHRAEVGPHVVLHMVDAGSCRDKAGGCRVADDELQEKLPPAVAAQRCGQRR